ncbi:MAG: methionine adenosyltransferase domain-containing protein, partial [Oscillospiraceae bacterium]|nr:methionine adenosyltransferase domain-containing protein [Oscillospiraceae bacterium]
SRCRLQPLLRQEGQKRRAVFFFPQLLTVLRSIGVETFGTGTVDDAALAAAVQKVFDLRPSAIIRDLELRRPIYRKLAAYGHMGREDLGVKWEQTDRIDALRAAVQ